jgi:hypothetical protein
MRAASLGLTHDCSDQTCDLKKVLANTEPSSHGTGLPIGKTLPRGESQVLAGLGLAPFLAEGDSNVDDRCYGAPRPEEAAAGPYRAA